MHFIYHLYIIVLVLRSGSDEIVDLTCYSLIVIQRCMNAIISYWTVVTNL